jgi:hypothetical protein
VNDTPPPDDPPDAVVKSATVMVAVQPSCSIDEDLATMRTTAEDADVTIEELAQQVLEGRVTRIFGRPLSLCRPGAAGDAPGPCRSAVRGRYVRAESGPPEEPTGGPAADPAVYQWEPANRASACPPAEFALRTRRRERLKDLAESSRSNVAIVFDATAVGRIDRAVAGPSNE